MCGDNERNYLALMMKRRHPTIKYCPLTLNFKRILEIGKKLNLRSKNEVPARRRKKKINLCTERQMNISDEHGHLLITYHIQDLAMSAIYEEIVPYIVSSQGREKNDNKTGNT